MITVVRPKHNVIARCPLGHTWRTTLEVLKDSYPTKKQGKRPFYAHTYQYGIDKCPECGHRQCGSVPVQ